MPFPYSHLMCARPLPPSISDAKALPPPGEAEPLARGNDEPPLIMCTAEHLAAALPACSVLTPCEAAPPGCGVGAGCEAAPCTPTGMKCCCCCGGGGAGCMVAGAACCGWLLACEVLCC